MSSTYYLSSLLDVSDTSGGTNLILGSAGTTTQTVTHSIAKSGTAVDTYQTEYYLPRNAAWGTVAFTVTLTISSTNSSITASATAHNTGTNQTSSASTAVACSTSTVTLSIPSTAWTAGSATDRIKITITFTNTNSMTSQSVGYTINASTASSLTSPVTEFSDAPGLIGNQAQYASDGFTVVPQGQPTGSTDANTTPLYLDQDIAFYNPGDTYTPDYEVNTASSAFSGTANKTGTTTQPRSSRLITARRGACLNYDSINKRYLCIGGYDGTNRFNDLWQIDANGTIGKWKILAPTGSGPAVFNLGASTQVNLNGKSWFVQFGGANSSGSPTGNLYICDTTTPGSEVWTTVTQTGGPGIRYYCTHHMVAVPTSSTAADVYFFGAASSGTAYHNDLYKFSLNLASTVPSSITWTTVTADGAGGSPGTRDGAILRYDSTNGRLLLVGGINGSNNWTDVWQYSISGGTWTSLTTSGDTFAGRELPDGGFDTTNQRFILWGGWNGTITTSRNDIFSIDVSSAGTAVFHQQRANDTSNQDVYAYSSGSACTDTDKNMIVEFGQNGYDTTDKYCFVYPFTNSTASSATLYGLNVEDHYRGGDAPFCVYDSDQARMLVINGFSTIDDDEIAEVANGDHHNQIWSYDLSSTMRYANAGFYGMVYKEGIAAAYDTTGKRVLVFGGLVGNGQVSQELWELKADAEGNYKARIMSPSGTKPGVRWLCACAYDATNNRFVIWGGENSSSVYSDFWSLDLSSGDGTWSNPTPTGTAPTGTVQPGYAYDSTNNRLFVYGGATNQAMSTFSSQVFYIDLSTSTPSYNILSPTGGTAGRGRALAYDSTNNALLAWSGETGSAVNATLEMLKPITASAWTTATPAGPQARRSTGYIYQGGKLYITRGRQHTGQFFNDTWQLTPNFSTLSSSTWANQNPNIYQRYQARITGETNNTAYEWQSWASVGSSVTTKVIFAGAVHNTGFYVGNWPTINASDAITSSESLTLYLPLSPLLINVDPSQPQYNPANLKIQIV